MGTTLSVLSSLALMLQLMASLLHVVSISTPGWVQFGVFVPAARPQENATGPGGHGVQYQGPTTYVQIGMGLWDWCEQLFKVSAGCQQPEFLPALGFLAVAAIVTLPLAFALLLSTCFLAPENRRRHSLTLGSLSVSIIAVGILLVLTVVYAVGTAEEVDKLFKAAGVTSEVRHLGWAFGTEVVTTILIGLAALFICIGLRHSSKAPPEFNLVV